MKLGQAKVLKIERGMLWFVGTHRFGLLDDVVTNWICWSKITWWSWSKKIFSAILNSLQPSPKSCIKTKSDVSLTCTIIWHDIESKQVKEGSWFWILHTALTFKSSSLTFCVPCLINLFMGGTSILNSKGVGVKHDLHLTYYISRSPQRFSAKMILKNGIPAPLRKASPLHAVLKRGWEKGSWLQFLNSYLALQSWFQSCLEQTLTMTIDFISLKIPLHLLWLFSPRGEKCYVIIVFPHPLLDYSPWQWKRKWSCLKLNEHSMRWG